MNWLPPTSIWADGSLASPETGRPLRRTGPFLVDGAKAERWPVVEEIPYLRAGREEMRNRSNDRLERGDEEGALAELLRDQDDWAPDPPPEPDAVREAVRVANSGGPARSAMAALGFGPVADYFSYRPSDPTYLAGLALLQAHWNAPRTSFELACGIGHYTRELSRRGVDASAGDVVFAKLWLARRYLTPEARLVCFDASRRFPMGDASVDLALCQDAFYFLPDKPHVGAELRRISGEQGTIVVGHSHNATVHNFSHGDPATVNRHAELFPEAALYDDAELTGAVTGKTPEPRSAEELSQCEAICLAQNGTRPVGGYGPDLLLPPPGTPLRLNPLYRRDENGTVRLSWPSERYREEYAPRSEYLPAEVEVEEDLLRRAAEEGTGASPEIDRLARRRVLVEQAGSP